MAIGDVSVADESGTLGTAFFIPIEYSLHGMAPQFEANKARMILHYYVIHAILVFFRTLCMYSSHLAMTCCQQDALNGSNSKTQKTNNMSEVKLT